MARALRSKAKKHICSMKGCANKDTHLFCRSEDYFGALYLCENCVKDMYEAVFGKLPAKNKQSNNKKEG